MIQTWQFPTRIVFGEGAVQTVGTEVLARGVGRVLIVTDKNVRRAGHVEAVRASLDAAGVSSEVFDGVSFAIPEKEFLEGSIVWRDSKASGIVAVGGGSVIDVAKLIALRSPVNGTATGNIMGVSSAGELSSPQRPVIGSQGEAQAFYAGAVSVGQLAPIFSVPTVAGTGSEVSSFAIVPVDQTGEKVPIWADALMPAVAIVDPALTRSASPTNTAIGGMNALANCIEGYLARGDHPMADAIGLAGIEVIADHLEAAVANGDDMVARTALMKAAIMGAVAAQKGVGASHALALAIASDRPVHHGLAQALCLPAVLDFNRAAVPVRVARIARMLGARGDDVETLAFECSGAVRALRRRVGLPEALSAIEIDESRFDRIIELAVHNDLATANPRECTVDELYALLRASA